MLQFDPWVGKIPWRRKWQHTPVYLPGKCHRQKSLVGYNPRGSKWLDITEHTHIHTHTHTSLAPKDDFTSLGGTRYIILGVVNHYFSKWELSTLFLKIPRILRERWEANLVLMGRCWGRSNTKRGLCVGIKLHVLSRKWGETQFIFILVPYKNRGGEDAQSHWQPHLFEEEYLKWNPQGCTGWEGNHLVPTWPYVFCLCSQYTWFSPPGTCIRLICCWNLQVPQKDWRRLLFTQCSKKPPTIDTAKELFISREHGLTSPLTLLYHDL